MLSSISLSYCILSSPFGRLLVGHRDRPWPMKITCRYVALFGTLTCLICLAAHDCMTQHSRYLGIYFLPKVHFLILIVSYPEELVTWVTTISFVSYHIHSCNPLDSSHYMSIARFKTCLRPPCSAIFFQLTSIVIIHDLHGDHQLKFRTAKAGQNNL